MNTSGIFTILYPERRKVPGSVIASWYADAHANGEIEHEVDPADVLSMARALDHAGHITLARGAQVMS